MSKPKLHQLLDEDYDAYADRHVRAVKRRRIGREAVVLDEAVARSATGSAPRSAQRSEHAILDETATHSDLSEVGAIFDPTFSASRHEREWILNYLGPFYDTQVILDVLQRVKGGKEANVYCCSAHPGTGLSLLAAKIYRPRMFRNLRNDAQYRQGRAVLDEYGKVVRDGRYLRAIRKGTRIGKEFAHTSWLEHEYQTMQILHAAGVDVPQPLASSSNTILMEYVGDEGLPAPALNEVRLARQEAKPLFDRLMGDVELMLSCGRIHGDLSAYNVLFWNGTIKIIDFPQAIDPFQNRDAMAIFRRDVRRICEYFAGYGVESDPEAIATDFWARYGPEEEELIPELPEEDEDDETA